MADEKPHLFVRADAALAYANVADRIVGDSADYLDKNPAVVPLFVQSLFQSLEISIKHVGIESTLINEHDLRDKKTTKNGHGVNELCAMLCAALRAETKRPLVSALTFNASDPQFFSLIGEMIYGEGFDRTREMYARRRLGYGEVAAGDFAIVADARRWVDAVIYVASNLSAAIRILGEWKSSDKASSTFGIWMGGTARG